MCTTEDLFQKQLHAYTITHAIEDGNVLRFHVDYFKPKEDAGKKPPKPGEGLAKRAVIEAILAKHDAATAGRRFNALLATASINDAIEYHGLFKTMQAEKLAADPDFKPLNIACVFSPPAEGDKDVIQIQEDLPQEKADNEEASRMRATSLRIAGSSTISSTLRRRSDHSMKPSPRNGPSCDSMPPPRSPPPLPPPLRMPPRCFWLCARLRRLEPGRSEGVEAGESLASRAAPPLPPPRPF